MFVVHDTSWMWLSMLVFSSLLVALAYYAVSGSRRSTGAQRGSRATEILEERYARGDISTEEYHETLRVLESRAPITRSSPR